MTGKELLPMIRAKAKGDRYSENLVKWVAKHKDWPMVVAFSKSCSITGNELHYSAGETAPRQIIIGIGDMNDGWIHGRRLTAIICKHRGVMSGNYAYGPQFKLMELPSWWEHYITGGKCFIDPEHKIYADNERWQVSEDGQTRKCLWCRNHEQHRQTELIERNYWVQTPTQGEKL